MPLEPTAVQVAAPGKGNSAKIWPWEFNMLRAGRQRLQLFLLFTVW